MNRIRSYYVHSDYNLVIKSRLTVDKYIENYSSTGLLKNLNCLRFFTCILALLNSSIHSDI